MNKHRESTAVVTSMWRQANLPVTSIASNVPGLRSHEANTCPIHEGTHDKGGALQDEILQPAQALGRVPSIQALMSRA